MFDIGFWEMAVIALVALLVIGPRELPVLIRGLSRWMARARKIAGEFKAEFTREVERAEELKRLVEQESEIAEIHRTLNEARKTVSIDGGRSSDADAGKDQDEAKGGGEVPKVTEEGGKADGASR